MIFAANIRCFDGDDTYSLAAGDLSLDNDVSDRPCTLEMHVTDTDVRGFIQCPNNPATVDDVFATSGAPIGRGYFELARSF